MSTIAEIESFEFQAETRQLLNLVIHSLYTDREIFLRELISNASDALDRLRFEALMDHKAVAEYAIRIKSDPVARTLTISDTGIGMSRREVIDNIGTIAKSGTQELRNSMSTSEPVEILSALIGRFGVGFYSAFMVADKVTILTRHSGEPEATRWESSGDALYTLERAEKLECGTEIVLHLKPADAEQGIDDFTDRWKISSIVQKYSDFIPYPIIYEGATTNSGSTPDAGDEKNSELITLNSMKPIWCRRRGEVKDTDYTDFYRRLTNDWTEPLRTLPLRAEGAFEYEALLFIPAQVPYDFFYGAAETGLRLYAKRVMVVDRCEELLPRYLRFIRGVVDSSDLPLNVSRQRLQEDRHIHHMRKWLTRKVLEALKDLNANDREVYLNFWKQFGRVLKEGVISDYENREKLASLLLFESSDSTDFTSLHEYVKRMKADQSELFYLSGECRKIIESSPHLEAVRQKGYEVLYLTDPGDELLVRNLQEFEGKRLRSIAKGRFSFDGNQEEVSPELLKRREEDYGPFLRACEAHLDHWVRELRLSSRLVNSPVCLVLDEHEFSPHVERVLSQGSAHHKGQRRIMELNADHPLVGHLRRRYENKSDDPIVMQSIEVLFGLALLAEGSGVSDYSRFSELTLDLLQKSV
jgi:molecular chaperone HtpG